MPKKRKGGDFSKQTQRVGKKKLAPTNATSTEFKARSVALPEQAQFAEGRDEPMSHRKQTASELLAQRLRMVISSENARRTGMRTSGWPVSVSRLRGSR